MTMTGLRCLQHGSTENAMTFFTVIGFLTLVVIFLYHFFQVRGPWYTAFTPGVRCCLGKESLTSFRFDVVDYFKEGVDVMLTRLQEYRDRRKNKIAKEVENRLKKEL